MSFFKVQDTVFRPLFQNAKVENEQIQTTNDFDNVFKAALNGLQEVNNLQQTADQAAADLAVGKVDNIHDVMIAQEKANIALQFTVEVKNKVLEAYNQIMRMPM